MPNDNQTGSRFRGSQVPQGRSGGRAAGTLFKHTATPGPSRSGNAAGHPGRLGRAVHGAVRPAYSRSAPARKTSPVAVAAAIVAAVAVLALFVFVGLPAVTSLISGDTGESVEAGVEVQITIPDGATGDQIASILSENQIIPDPQDYYAAVRNLQADTMLKPGSYLFTTLQDPEAVVRQLMEGPNVTGPTLTIPEGLTVDQTAACVEEALGIPAADFIAQAKASNYAADYPFLSGAADDSLEGFLYPKTYTLSGDPTADEVIRTMLDQYQVEVASLDLDAARATIQSRYGVEMSDYEFLILASIIEREALTEDQRYNVSSTFYNRFEAGMPLQSDATMMYVTGGEVTADDLKVESPYNTYLNQGLPPTPICAPSLSSIQAALEPADTNYLYFFITSDEEYFSETYDDHLQAIEASR